MRTPELNGTIAGINKKCKGDDERVIITIREGAPSATKMKAKTKNLVLLSSVIRRIRYVAEEDGEGEEDSEEWETEAEEEEDEEED